MHFDGSSGEYVLQAYRCARLERACTLKRPFEQLLLRLTMHAVKFLLNTGFYNISGDIGPDTGA